MSELIMIAADKNAAQRTCGACSLCCKVFKLKDPAIAKPADVWCKHCAPGKGGCGIYAARPSECSSFECNWLTGQFPKEWYPFKSKMVSRWWHGESGAWDLEFYVDPKYPKHWKKEPYYGQLKQLAALGVENRFSVHVIVGDRVFIILPTRDIERGINEFNAAMEGRSSKMERENNFYTKHIAHLPSVPLDAPYERGRVYHTIMHHDRWCAIYDNKECDCEPTITRHIEPPKEMSDDLN